MIRGILPCALFALASLGAQAETVSMPDSGATGADLPGRGLSMEAVEETYGSPAGCIRISPSISNTSSLSTRYRAPATPAIRQAPTRQRTTGLHHAVRAAGR